jgi:hypothetical protein
LLFETASNGTEFERLRIDSSGRLLVGTNSGTDLSGVANANFVTTATGSRGGIAITHYDTSASSDPVLALRRSGSNSIGTYTAIGANRRHGTIGFYGTDGTGFAEGAQIRAESEDTWAVGDNPGRLVFSTTADGASSPTERMRIRNAGWSSLFGDGEVCSFRTAGSASASDRLIYGIHSATNITTGGTLSFIVRTNGDIENANNVYTQISDIKLKENIVDAGSQWDDFKAVRFRKFNFKESTGYETHTQLGVIAQELELTSPGLVNETVDRDAEGNDLGTTTKSVKMSILTQKALVALQEAMERIEQLEAKVAALEAN